MSAAKIRNFLLNLYPELSRLRLFSQISTTVIPSLTPRLKRIMRWGLPIATVTLVLTFGLVIGSLLLGLFFPKTVVPIPLIVVTPTPATTYQSPYLLLKRALEAFNPQLPDPFPPVLDANISLEPLAD